MEPGVDGAPTERNDYTGPRQRPVRELSGWRVARVRPRDGSRPSVELRTVYGAISSHRSQP